MAGHKGSAGYRRPHRSSSREHDHDLMISPWNKIEGLGNEQQPEGHMWMYRCMTSIRRCQGGQATSWEMVKTECKVEGTAHTPIAVLLDMKMSHSDAVIAWMMHQHTREASCDMKAVLIAS